MSENGRSELTSKQRKGLDALLEGVQLETVALAAGVNVRTVHRWQRDPAFVAELRTRQRILSDRHLTGLTSELRRNRLVMAEIRDDEDSPPAVRLRAAQILDELLLKWRDQVDLEERIAALEDQINAV